MAVAISLLRPQEESLIDNLDVIKISLGKTDAVGFGMKDFQKACIKRFNRLQVYKRRYIRKGRIRNNKYNNSPKGKERDQRYKEKNREVIARRTHERCSKQNYIIQKEWNRNNKERLKEIQRKHEQKPERKSYRKEWLKNNVEKSLEWSNNYINKLIKKAGLENIISTEAFRWAIQNWGVAIRHRDKVCQVCGSKKKLNAHHIFYKIHYPALALNRNNGITLCEKCHDELHYKKRIEV